MNLEWDEDAWYDYLYWQEKDRKTLKRVNELLKDILRNKFSGIGKPELLKHKNGYWSRRIDEANRLVYKIEGDKILIAAMKGHYDD